MTINPTSASPSTNGGNSIFASRSLKISSSFLTEKSSSSGNRASPHWALKTVIFRRLKGESKSSGCKFQKTREGSSVVRIKLVGESSRSEMRKADRNIARPTIAPKKPAESERNHSEREAYCHHKVHKTRAIAGGATSQMEACTPNPIPARRAATRRERLCFPGSVCQRNSSSRTTTKKAMPGVYTSAMTACDQKVYEIPSVTPPKAAPIRLLVK